MPDLKVDLPSRNHECDLVHFHSAAYINVRIIIRTAIWPPSGPVVMFRAICRRLLHMQSDMLNGKPLPDGLSQATHKQINVSLIIGVYKHMCSKGGYTR